MVTWQWSLVFLVAAAVLVPAAVILAKAGDEIAERTGLGGVLVGTILLAGTTSLPEVVTDVAAALADAPDLAVGDLFGSSMANMAILAVLDLAHRGRVWPSVELARARVAATAIALTALAALAIATPPGLQIGWVGLDTIAIAEPGPNGAVVRQKTIAVPAAFQDAPNSCTCGVAEVIPRGAFRRRTGPRGRRSSRPSRGRSPGRAGVGC